VRGDLLVQRLKQLEAMQLAMQSSSRQWSLAPQIETTLRRMGERGDIIKTMHRALKDQQLERDPQSWQMDRTDSPKNIAGKIIARGLSDEHRDRHYLIVDGIDGRVHYVNAGSGSLAKDYRRGALVEVIASAETTSRKQSNVGVQLLSRWTLEDQVQADGATWLDKRLVHSTPESDLATTGFGNDVQQALAQRQRWLVAQGLAEDISAGDATSVRLKPGLLETLRNRDLNRAAITLAKDTGIDVDIVRKGDALSGTLVRRLDLVSGQFAVIDQSQSRGLGLAIAPWTSALNRVRSQQVSGIMMGSQMRWNLEKGIGMEIS
jgi:Protein of unknown function (DUF3363)